jgi:sugar lactone lactonase YvrE
MSNLEHILSSQDMVGESPVWSVDEQALYWVDILGCRFHRYHPETSKYETYTVDVSIGAIALRSSGGLVMGTGKGFATYDLNTSTITFLAHPEADSPHMRFNDGNVDCRGSFWAGTMSNLSENLDLLQGKLYRLDPDGSVHIMDTGFALINGMGWSPNNTQMYVVDSARKVVYLYDFDLSSSTITNRRLFLNTSEMAGVPDGLTVDSEGAVWIAFWDGWKIIRFDPGGKRIGQIDLPVQCPTSCAFGGRHFDELYITSAWEELSEEQRTSQPFAGDLFRLRTGNSGLPQPLFLG